ncbi:mechanosensitive ion channel family protein (plasmid) [Halobacterium sp. NMX12-1]|uniref:Mechanosensitive ion channel family protein n=1 Tax=Halobacterium sp. NMX12-1 TaxID=3166650 RepID=A0AAU8C8R8_9EURY
MKEYTGTVPSELTILQSSISIDETLAIVAAAMLTGVVIWYLGTLLEARFRAVNAKLARSLLLLLLAGGVGFVLVQQWGATGALVSLTGVLEFGVDTALRILITVFLFVAAHTFTQVVKRILLSNNRSNGRATSEHQRRIIFYISQVIVYIAAAVATLSLWGIQISDLLLGAGVLGIILGLAFQSTLGSILAGFVLMLSRPFEIGDWVRIGDHEGFITEISINHVRLRNLDGEHVVLPNEAVSNRTIINRSDEGKLRHTIEVGVDYDVDPERAEAIAREAISDLNEIMSQPAPQVLPVRFGDSAVVLEVRVWIDNPTPQRRWRAARAVIYAVKTAFNEEDVKIPFPQRELTGRHEDDGFRIRNANRDSHNPTKSE